MPFMGMGNRGFNPAMGMQQSGGPDGSSRPGGPPPMQGPDDRIFVMPPPMPQMGEDGQMISPQIMAMPMEGHYHGMEGHQHGMPMPMDPSVMPSGAPEQMDPAVAKVEQKPTIRRQRTKSG
jgi:hypothetical protein